MKKTLVLFVLLSSILLTNCKKDKVTHAPLTIKSAFAYGKSDFNFNTPINYMPPQKISISSVIFYITNIKLTKDDNSIVDLSEFPLLFEDGKYALSIPKVPLGRYTKIEMGLGVPANINTQNGADAIIATDYPQDSPLNPATNMYWGWANGYIFSKFEGRIDVDGNGSFIDNGDILFSYHPGNDALYRTISLPIDLNITESANNELNFQIDLLNLLSGLDFATTAFAHPASNSGTEYEAAKLLVDQWQSSIIVK